MSYPQKDFAVGREQQINEKAWLNSLTVSHYIMTHTSVIYYITMPVAR
jgi:hypothetical protein